MKKLVVSSLLLLAVSCYAGFTDTDRTIGLWHFNYAAAPVLQDDNINTPNRNNDLVIYGCAPAQGLTDDAMLFAATTDYVNSRTAGGSYLTPWKGFDMGLTSVKIEARFRVDVKAGTHWLVDLGEWNGPTIYTDNSAVKFYYKLNDGTSNTLAVYGVPNPASNPTDNPWITVTAVVNPYTKTASLLVEGIATDPASGLSAVTLAAGQALNTENWEIEIGGDNTYGGSPTANRHFFGVIDELKISTFDDFTSWGVDYSKPLQDDKYTQMLYHMEEFVNSTYIEDDDSANPGRNADIQTLFCNVVPGKDGLGNALDFNGNNSVAIAGGVTGTDWWNFPWKAHPSVKIEAWFNVETKAGDHFIAQIGNWTATLFTSNTALIFSYKMDNGVSQSLTVYAVPNVIVGTAQWVHAVAEFNHFTGKASLKVQSPIAMNPASGYVENDVAGRILMPEFAKVEIGQDANGTSRKLDGQIDELRISVLPETVYDPHGWQEVYQDNKGTQALWHFDEEIIVGSNRTTPDDDSFASRDNDLTLYDGDNIAGTLDGPQFITNDPNRTTAYLFDGVNDYMKASTIDFDPQNFRVEAWVKFNGAGSGTYPIVWQQGSYLLMIESGKIYWVVAIGDGSQGLKGVTYDYAAYNDGKWHHIAGTFLRGWLKIHIDGKFAYATNLSTTSASVATGGDIYVGKFVNTSGEHFWDGLIDEVRISQAYPAYGCGSWGYLPGDFTQDCVVNTDDLVKLAAMWLQSTETFDLTKDGYVDYNDYSVMSEGWLECTDPLGTDCQNLN